MALNFPDNPNVNDTFTTGGTTFTYDGTGWKTSNNQNIVSDSSPQLGGHLDLNNKNLSGHSNFNIVGVVTASSFTGDLTGNVTGDVTGDVTGNVTGDVTGNAGTATVATNAQGLTGTPNIIVGTISGTNATFSGDLTVQGTTSTVNSNTLNSADKTVGIGSTTPASNSTADDCGILVFGGTDGDKKLLWKNSTGNWTFSGGNCEAPKFVGIGSDLTQLDADDLTYGTVPDARFPATLPAASGANLTNLPAANLTGTLPAIDGSNLTGIGGGLPTGIITMWYGALNAVPTGWVLCDGQNSTPDLRDKFVIGAGSAYSVGDTGGSANSTLVSHSHTINSHSHTFSGSDNVSISVSGTTSNQSQNHTHVGTTNTTGQHDHRWGANTFPGQVGSSADLLDNPQGNGGGNKSADTSDAGNHSHSFTTAGISNDHNHSFSGSGSDNVNISGTTSGPSDTGTNAQGSSSTNTNLPPYHALCFIMKT